MGLPEICVAFLRRLWCVWEHSCVSNYYTMSRIKIQPETLLTSWECSHPASHLQSLCNGVAACAHALRPRQHSTHLRWMGQLQKSPDNCTAQICLFSPIQFLSSIYSNQLRLMDIYFMLLASFIWTLFHSSNNSSSVIRISLSCFPFPFHTPSLLYVYICICGCKCVFSCMCTCVHMCMSVHMCMCDFMRVCLCVCVFMHVYMCAYVCVYSHTYAL